MLTYVRVDLIFEIKLKKIFRFQGHSQRDTQVYGATGSDLDLLFPERIRHKTVGVYITYFLFITLFVVEAF